MKTVIYLDVLLLVNFLVAYFLLQTAGLLSDQRSRFGRLLAGAGLAALSALILLAPELPYAGQLAYRLGSAALICRVAFGVRSWRRWAAATVWYAALNLLLAGFALLYIYRTGSHAVQTANMAVYLRISPLLLLGLAAVCCLGAGLVMRVLAPAPGAPHMAGLELELCGTPLRLRAALDTGCHLKDPMTCLPVLLISYPDARARLPSEVDDFLDSWFAGQRGARLPPGARLRMIPCATASGNSLLPGFVLDSAGLITKRGVLDLGRAAAAFSPQTLGGSYEALYGADLLPAYSGTENEEGSGLP